MIEKVTVVMVRIYTTVQMSLASVIRVESGSSVTNNKHC